MTESLRNTILKAGGLRLIRSLDRRSVRILLYHRFPAAAVPLLEAQCAHLRRYYSPVSMDDVARWLRGDLELPPNAIAVTIDDGYRDIHEVAWPVFSAFRIPVTAYVSTGFLDGRCWLWVDRLDYVFRNTRAASVDLALPAGDRWTLALHTPELRRDAAATVKRAAKRMSHQAASALIAEELPDRLRVSVPAVPPPESRPLLWNEVRQMAAGGLFSFGAHTQTHPILSSLGDLGALREEILGSKRRLEEELAVPVRHFSYPNGTAADISPAVLDVVRAGGFDTAVTAQGGSNPRDLDAFLLRRNTVEPQTPELLFGKYATGFRRS